MKGFSDRERESIDRSLVEAGRTLFKRYGLERTRIADLTEQAGIGTSTFYQFHESKEALYLEVLLVELAIINESLLAEIADAPTLEEEISGAMHHMFDELENNPIYYRLIVENEWEILQRRLPEVTIQSHYEDTIATFSAGAQQWADDENFVADDPAMIIDLFRMLAQIVRTRDSFDTMSGSGRYETVREFLIEIAVNGMVRDRGD